MTVIITNSASTNFPSITACGTNMEVAMEVYVCLVNMHALSDCDVNTNMLNGYYMETILTTANMQEFSDLNEHMQEVYGVALIAY